MNAPKDLPLSETGLYKATKAPDGSVIMEPITQAQLDDVRARAKRVIEKARAYIVLDQPFFASIMLKHEFEEKLSVPTMAVTNGGHIYYNPFFVAELTAQQVQFVLCHEIMHYASGHGPRMKGRKHKEWNIAGDLWINDTLIQSNIGEPVPGMAHKAGAADETVEDLYEWVLKQQGNGGGGGKDKKKGKGDQQQQAGNGPGGDDPMGDDLDTETDHGQTDSATEAQRKLDVAEAAQVAKMKGKLPGKLAQFAAETLESRVPWFDILERFMTARVQNDYSWARPNRRYAPDFYLPIVDGIGAMGEIVCQVDISGSVSPLEIKHYNGHLKRIVEQCRPSKVHVIYTDTQVQKHEIFDKPEDLEIRFYSGGGTHMPAGYDYVLKHGIEPEVFITLTDGYTGWDKEPPFPTIHCISSKERAPYGENIHFDLKDEVR